ncbi:MAG: hypothetical protein H6704_10110 [Myxococcales bacterium]|nr:hypothetical protein [Myxococcales bacterium]
MGRNRAWLLGALLLWGCPDDDDPAADAGPPVMDAAAADRGPRPDAAADARARDAAPTDAALADAATDAAPPDAAADAAPTDAGPGDLGVSAPPDEAPPPPPLFDPAAPDADPMDAPLAMMVDAWRARPTDEASARARELALADASRMLAEGGARAADRIVERCRPVPVHARDTMLVCLRLSSLVHSDASIDWLAELGGMDVPPWPEGFHPVDPAPEDLTAQVATWALGRRAAAGSERALEQLLRLVASPDTHDRRHAVRAVFEALPRVRAKAALRNALPRDQHYRLYQWR